MKEGMVPISFNIFDILTKLEPFPNCNKTLKILSLQISCCPGQNKSSSNDYTQLSDYERKTV